MVIIGHRGAKGLAPENTLTALRAGMQAGADMLEVDVRVTSDGVPVLHHDPALNGLKIHKTTLAKLRAAKPDIATLEEALSCVNRRLPLILEIKPGVAVQPIVQVLASTKWRPRDFRIASFDFNVLKQACVLLPNMQLTVLDAWSGIRATRRAKKLHTPYLCMKKLFLWRGFVRHVQKRGFKLSIYTVNTKREVDHWKKLGVYGIVTDFPALDSGLQSL